MRTRSDRELLAYLAGVVDGEGCIRIERKRPTAPQKTPKFTIIFSVQMSDKPVLDLFASRFGCKVSRRTFKNHRDKKVRRTAWRFQVHAKRAAEIIREILPFLVGKAEQARLVLGFYERFSAVRRGRILTEDEIAARMAIHDRVCELKRIAYD